MMLAAKQTLVAVVVFSCVGFAGSAMAQGADIGLGIGIPLAPGQAGTSPGQVFNSARITTPGTALPPGQAYIQNKSSGALPPGQTFTNPGRAKK
jgi:hypothetical protein